MIIDSYQEVSTQVLVVGGGGAGMRAAIEAAETDVDVLLITKGQAARSGATPMACPSYQAAFAVGDSRDSFEIAFEDTCYEGRYLGDENLIQVLTQEATKRAEDLIEYGVKFRRMEDGKLYQVVHPGHSYERNLVIRGNGYALAAGLRREMLRKENIKLMEDVVLTSVIKEDGRVAGVVGLNMRTGHPVVIQASSVVMATGGYPELWRWTDTEPGLTGEGVHIAHEAGADLVDMEMMLFYPTGLCYPPEVEGTLVQYEGLLTDKYCGGEILNGDGRPFLPSLDRLPVRDVMMKLMFREIEEGRATPHGGVYIDLQKSPRSSSEIQEILESLDSLPYDQLRDLGVNVLEERIEVKPVTHYTLGGVRINEWCETSVPGLYAAGEVSGNIHGANRTSGNALAETQVFGARAGKRAAEYVLKISPHPLDEEKIQEQIRWLFSFFDKKENGLRPIEAKREVKTVMHEQVHHQRDAGGLKRAIDELERIIKEDLPRLEVTQKSRIFNYEWEEAIEVTHMAKLSKIVASSSLARDESRGHHWRLDFPKMRQIWEKHTLVRRLEDGYSIEDSPVIRIKDRSKERRPLDPGMVTVSEL